MLVSTMSPIYCLNKDQNIRKTLSRSHVPPSSRAIGNKFSQYLSQVHDSIPISNNIQPTSVICLVESRSRTNQVQIIQNEQNISVILAPTHTNSKQKKWKLRIAKPLNALKIYKNVHKHGRTSK